LIIPRVENVLIDTIAGQDGRHLRTLEKLPNSDHSLDGRKLGYHFITSLDLVHKLTLLIKV